MVIINFQKPIRFSNYNLIFIIIFYVIYKIYPKLIFKTK